MPSTDRPQPRAQKIPKQQLGDTPVAPWEMPTPAEKAKVEPVRQALQDAVEKVNSPEQADAVAARLEGAAGGRKAEAVQQAGQDGPSLGEAAQAVQRQADPAAPAAKQASDVIAKTVETVTAAQGRDREALAQATQEVLNPEQQGTPLAPAQARQRQYLREAMIKRMQPLDALDARLYLGLNHLPHNRWLNGGFYLLTQLFRGGAAWYGLLGLLALRHRRSGGAVARQVGVPLALSSLAVEFPVKTFFRRRRPFITILKATVVGKKPGSYSFPSGHSAAAFGGAYLLSRHFPRWRWVFYTVAALVGFSRIYLGDHYPGDVVSGSVAGIVLAKGAAELQETLDQAQSRARRRL
jgi:undecaprenyl-diphosphatase